MSKRIQLVALAIFIAGTATVHADLNSGLVAYYPFNGNANDASGNGRDGTIMNTPTFITGRVGQAIHFQGRGHTGTSGDHVIIPSMSFSSMPSFSISLWARIEGDSGEGHGEGLIFFGHHNNGWVGVSYWGTPYVIGFGVGGADVSTPMTSSYWNNWKLYTLVYNQGALKGYVDGQLIGSANGTVVQATTDAGMGIHWFNNGVSTRYIGALDEVRIYNRALSASEVQQLYQLGSTLTDITITGPSTVSAGSVTPYTCIATFSNGGTLDVSSQATWRIDSTAPSGTSFSGNKLNAGRDVNDSSSISVRATYTSENVTRTSNILPVTIQPVFNVVLSATPVSYYQDDTTKAYFWNVTLNSALRGPYALPITYRWDLDDDGLLDDYETTQSQFIYAFRAGRTYLLGVHATDAIGSIVTAWKYVTLDLPSGSVPNTDLARDILGGAFSDKAGNPFSFDPAKKQNGLIILTHGLCGSGYDDWLRTMASQVEQRLGNEEKLLPNIAIYDWKEMANPDKFTGGLGGTSCASGWSRVELDDYKEVRTYGLAHGRILADWVSAQTAAGNIDATKPIHIIGHSAGGFVAGECATVLKPRGIGITQVTMLDTPFPVRSHFTQYPNPGKVERYISRFGDVAPALNFIAKGCPYYYERSLNTLNDSTMSDADAHSYSHGWYLTNTVINGETDGFYYSPVMNNGFHGCSGATLLAGQAVLQASQSTNTITDFSTFGDVGVSDGTYTVTNVLDAGIYKLMTLPVGVQHLQFRYRFTTPGDGDFLSVHWGTNTVLYVGHDLTLSRDNYINGEVWLADYAGQTDQVIFKLVSRNEPNAVLTLDSITLTVSDDPDGDGLTTAQEQGQFGTDPLRADTDGDGLSDGDEVNIYGTNPLLVDSDGDGFSDYQEVMAGLNPNDAASVFQVTKMTKNTDDSIAIEWTSAAGKSYSVFRTTDLSWNSFTTLTNGVAATPPANTFTDTTATGAPFYFYRVGVE